MDIKIEKINDEILKIYNPYERKDEFIKVNNIDDIDLLSNLGNKYLNNLKKTFEGDDINYIYNISIFINNLQQMISTNSNDIIDNIKKTIKNYINSHKDLNKSEYKYKDLTIKKMKDIYLTLEDFKKLSDVEKMKFLLTNGFEDNPLLNEILGIYEGRKYENRVNHINKYKEELTFHEEFVKQEQEKYNFYDNYDKDHHMLKNQKIYYIEEIDLVNSEDLINHFIRRYKTDGNVLKEEIYLSEEITGGRINLYDKHYERLTTIHSGKSVENSSCIAIGTAKFEELIDELKSLLENESPNNTEVFNKVSEIKEEVQKYEDKVFNDNPKLQKNIIIKHKDIYKTHDELNMNMNNNLQDVSTYINRNINSKYYKRPNKRNIIIKEGVEELLLNMKPFAEQIYNSELSTFIYNEKEHYYLEDILMFLKDNLPKIYNALKLHLDNEINIDIKKREKEKRDFLDELKKERLSNKNTIKR